MNAICLYLERDAAHERYPIRYHEVDWKKADSFLRMALEYHCLKNIKIRNIKCHMV
jgi:hypothetical protein